MRDFRSDTQKNIMDSSIRDLYDKLLVDTEAEGLYERLLKIITKNTFPQFLTYFKWMKNTKYPKMAFGNFML